MTTIDTKVTISAHLRNSSGKFELIGYVEMGLDCIKCGNEIEHCKRYDGIPNEYEFQCEKCGQEYHVEHHLNFETKVIAKNE